MPKPTRRVLRPALAAAALLALAGPGRADVTKMSKGAALCLGRIAEQLIDSRSIKVLEVAEEAEQGVSRDVMGTDIVFQVVDAKGTLRLMTGTCKIRTSAGGELSVQEFFLPFAE